MGSEVGRRRTFFDDVRKRGGILRSRPERWSTDWIVVLGAACSTVNATWVCDRANHQCAPPISERCAFGLGGCFGIGYCSAQCVSDGDCPSAEYICQGAPLVYNNKNTGNVADDAVDVVNFCLHLPGSRDLCTKEADCTAADESCITTRNLAGTAELRCSSAYSSAAANAGEACGNVGGETVFCKTGFCDFLDGDTDGTDNTDDPANGTCASICVGDGDCPSALTCQDYTYGATDQDVVKICRTATAG